ncbi:topoisomerase family protein TRF4 [Penicillium verhagenii]|uniref:topoisomerase family protein TRF4 n=1 Tax=Penicillium verhagenii TaxID=1562060 RepID=UPI002545B5AA|nr:topoisomerase family protein TRF4 [Penicillium verhagenii]KAJ5915473.1 topoisomerase family protein TRF4 [Penicillium verhagenii]
MPTPFQFRGNALQNDRNTRGRPRDYHRGSRGRHEFTFRAPRPTAERPLLSTKRETTPEQLQAEDGSGKPALKFASLNSLSDSEEAEMDFSEDSDEEHRPRKKRAVGIDGHESPVSLPLPPPIPTPKWSNPDPYTALPPPDESQHKRVDFVKLIRKARLASSGEAKQNTAVVDNEDFISLGTMNQSAGSEETENKAPENAPRGPRGMEIKGAATKRGRDEQSTNFPTRFQVGKPKAKFNSNGSILRDWLPSDGQNPTPWLSKTEQSKNPSTRLHLEIVAFYNFVKPHDYEQIVRADLVDRLRLAFQRRYGRVQILAFGSFASGLYLPVADIDLVLLSAGFQDMGRKYYGEKKGQIYSFAAFIRDQNLAIPGTVETIAHARVPILKYVDRLTGLKVDLSFDNDSGLVANNTFQAWKSEFPIIPIIVSIIKQFLLLRGLHEVPTGGLGGFSITCLVTSLLQHMPKSDQQNAGTILVNFFNFYGNEFDYQTTGIRLNPPAYYTKYFGNPDRLMIEDPNNPSNDISGGTKEIPLIFRAFKDAHRSLKRALETYKPYNSMLKDIIGANFDEYDEQRYQLREFFEQAPQFARHRKGSSPPPPPPPPPPYSRAPAPPLPPGPPPPTHPRRERKRKSDRQSSVDFSVDHDFDEECL